MTLREDALYASYRRLERPLYNVLYRQLWQAQDCQDVIHDAFLRVWERRTGVDETTLDALLWTTALNLARNRLRWRKLWRHEPLDETAPPPDEGGAPTDFLATRRLRKALRELPKVSRDVLLLSEFSGLRGAEIARVLGIPAGTVASRKHHAMERLKILLGEPDHA
ncbi:RNA polymerase sigma factor [Rhodanobacter sp. DHB23]|uniref:RNA polymerase sigma factor n=1 Tax=Rhodanobacter sp. DHB23 TaxID=2775923 RepID=UPI00177C9CE3|nr:RNA polymerase sigma factor [Rhodanobacter sp. DHB23]MBD8874149.1 RNA polymerase sigma factor [Rhodanobacter sp. DHB23]